MLSTCRNVPILIAVTLVVLPFYAGSPCKMVIAGPRGNVNTLLRQILSENLPWSPLSVPAFAIPHENQEGLEASMQTKFNRHVVAGDDLH